MTTDEPNTNDYVAGGTRVLSTEDGEPGTVLGGCTCEGSEWFEYEVETQYGIEIWRRDQFVLMAEIEAAAEEGGER